MPKKNTSKSTPPLAASWPEKPPPDYSSGGRVDPTLTDGRWFYYPPRSWVRLDTLSVLELARRDVGAGATRTPEEIEAARVALSMSNALRQFAEEIAQDATPPARRASAFVGASHRREHHQGLRLRPAIHRGRLAAADVLRRHPTRRRRLRRAAQLRVRLFNRRPRAHPERARACSGGHVRGGVRPAR